MYRQVTNHLQQLLTQPQPPVLLILGMRHVGKSTLAENLALDRKKGFVKFNFDLLSDIQEFVQQDRHSLALFAQKYAGQTIIVDEIQKMPAATAIVKHLHDTYHSSFILTGSSEIKIRQGLGDSLTGRVHEIHLYPLSLTEINLQSGLSFNPRIEYSNYEINQQNLLNYLIYGSLPQLLNLSPNQHETYLDDYTNTLFSKDILEISGTRKSTQVYALAKLLALQIGQLVNFNELAVNTELSRESVYRYLDIFAQMGIITKAKPISTNERESIAKATKIYFTDLGVRNSLIGNFQPFSNRIDKGQLLENAVFIGIKRRHEYTRIHASLGFFRSPYGSEIDIVEKIGTAEKLLEVKTNRPANRIKKNITIINLKTAQKYLY